jgi:tetratricopeptide (TPR) repeat protein
VFGAGYGGGSGGGSGAAAAASGLFPPPSPSLYPPASPSVHKPATGKNVPFRDALASHPLFLNPEALGMMRSAYHVNDHGSLLARPSVAPGDTYEELRKLQNANWARETLRLGVTLAKRGSKEDLEQALKHYKHAIEIDARYSDAYTARGAAYVLLHKFDYAIADFDTALRLNPADGNALKYRARAEELV